MKKDMNPYVGRPGFWNRVNSVVYLFMGPAHVGIGVGKTEAPYVPPANPLCPMCSKPMADHSIQRGDATTPTYVSCPK